MRSYLPFFLACCLGSVVGAGAQEVASSEAVEEARAVLEEVRVSLDASDETTQLPSDGFLLNSEPTETMVIDPSALETEVVEVSTEASQDESSPAELPMDLDIMSQPDTSGVEMLSVEEVAAPAAATECRDCPTPQYKGADTDDVTYQPGNEEWLDKLSESCKPDDEVVFLPIDEVIRRHAAKMKHEARLHWKASKGMSSDPVEHLEMVYESRHAMTVEKARKLLVFAVESLLSDLHPGEWVHPGLGHCFSPSDLTIEIRFDNFHAKFVDRQFVEVLRMEDETVSYWAYNCNGPRACQSRQERYWDARDFVRVDLENEGKHRNLYRRRDLGEGVEKVIPFDGIFDIKR